MSHSTRYLWILAPIATFNSIPFHRFISGNEAHDTDDTNIRQQDRRSVQTEQ